MSGDTSEDLSKKILETERKLLQQEKEEKEEMQKLYRELEQLKEKRADKNRQEILLAVIKSLAFSSPLFVIFFLSFYVDIQLYLGLAGIILILVVYFGTLISYLYFKSSGGG